VPSSNGQQSVDIYLVLCAYIYVPVHHNRDVEATQPVEIRGRTNSAIAPQLQQRLQQLLAIHAIEPGWHYTDYGIWHSIHLKGFPDSIQHDWMGSALLPNN
jgi:hypothetical protein